MSGLTQADLAEIASEVNQHYQTFDESGELIAAVRVGAGLRIIKRQLGPLYAEWLQDHFAGDGQEAALYIRLAGHYEEGEST